MDQWEALIDGYPPSPDIRLFGKVLQTAGVVLKEDLAPFEVEWITETLLFKPVEMLTTIALKRNDDSWSKPIGDAFKLLTEAVNGHSETVEGHYEEIVTVCLKSYDARTREQALHCLTAIARRSSAGARDVARHFTSLEEVATCKAPLAILIGTICEHHPETVADDVTKIWRIYLNLLDGNKNTDKITSSVLQGIRCLFNHFGSDLPTAELNDFYEKMSKDFVSISKCEGVCLSILDHHSNLFCERLSRDARTRAYLWRILEESRNASRALRASYSVICGVLNGKELQDIITTELLPRSQSYRTQVKYTALRILMHIQTTHKLNLPHLEGIDTQTLEFDLRNENVSYDIAEAVSWCIESNLPNSDKLLQTAILFNTNLPATRRKEIAAHGILNAPDELRTASIIFLTTETCQDSTIDNHLTLWKDLFDTNKGQDIVVLEKSRLVFEDFMGYVVYFLETFLDEYVEKVPDKLTTLLTLTAQVLSLQAPDHFTNEHCTMLLPLLVQTTHRYGATAVLTAAMRCALVHTDGDFDDVWKTIHIDRCRDEALLCESCLTLIESPSAGNEDSVLTALQIIFSRNDVEPKTLSKALKKLDTFIVSEIGQSHKHVIGEILSLVENLRERNDMSGKDARILHRDVILFLGKYGAKSDMNNNLSASDNTLIVKLKDTLILNLPNPHEGTTYKINLQRILQLALIHEEPKSLQTLLTILCANLSTRKDPSLQMSLAHVVRALASAHSRGATLSAGAMQAAVLLCDSCACVQELLTYISEEKSPGVRKMLSDALEALLIKDPGSDLTESLVNTVAEQAVLMMNSEYSTTKRAGLDISETLINALKENNSLATKLLPNLLILIAKTKELDSEIAFEFASKLFIEKIDLFDKDICDNLVRDLFKVLLQNGGVKNKMDDHLLRKIFRNSTKMILEFVKKVYDYKKEPESKIIDTLFGVYEKQNGADEFFLYVLAEIKRNFDLKTDLCRNVLSCNDFFVLNKLFCMEIRNDFRMEAVLVFLELYFEMLLELQYQKTLQFVSKIITELTSNRIKNLQRNIESCLSVYITKFKNIPQILLKSFEEWCKSLPIKAVTQSIEKDLFTAEHALTVQSLKIMLNIFKLTDLSILTDVSVDTQKWTRIILKLFSTDYVKKYLKTKMTYLTDLLTVAVKFCKVTGVKRLILEGHSLEGVSNEKIGLKFCKFFINVFYDILIEKPFILMDAEMESCCILLNDIVKYALKKKCTDLQYDSILELIEQLWPKYEAHTTFNQKHSLLLDLSNLPRKLGAESNLLLWARGVVSSDASREDKARIIGVLPGGDAYAATYRTFASSLPTRLSEMSGSSQASLRALLDALAANSDLQLLDIVMTLSGGDDTTGWWDEAIDSCMASVASQGDLELYKAVYTRCWDGLSLGVCKRVMIPLLRYSTPQFCEKFFSTSIEHLLSLLGKAQRVASAQYAYRKCLVDYTRALCILQVAFEKIPPASLESPTSLLYGEAPPDQSWYLVRRACKLCDTLRELTVTDEALKDCYRQFQCANYNCITAAICRRQPAASFYDKCVFNAQAWAKIVDCDVTYRLPLKSQWNQRTKRHATSIEVTGSGLTSLSRPSLSHTRLFLRTLSECVLQYDLIAHTEASLPQTQDLQLNENELNSHECAATVTAVICHVTALSHVTWRDAIVSTLTGNHHPNVKFLITQAICNCKDELSPHASVLRPALLAMIADTASVENGKRLLNGLHIDVLETLIYWSDDSPQSSVHLNTTLNHLVTTCLENGQRQTIFRSLLDTLTKLCNMYGKVVNISWSVFEPYIQVTSQSIKEYQVLQRIVKSKIHIPELLPTLISKFETKQWGQLPKMSELYGLALSACPNVSGSILARFRRVLEQLKSHNKSDYVKMLYYAQMGNSECCNESDFRSITDRVPKTVGIEKSKCLHILSSFIARNPHNEYIPDMYETIEVSELITGEHCVEALGVVAEGLKVMAEGVRRRVIMQVAGYCQHSLVKVRKAACQVMLRAFEDLCTSNSSPSAKRPRTISTPITSALDSEDVYDTTVLTCLGYGVIDRVDEIAKVARDGVTGRLASDMGLRFTECFIIAVYLPITATTNKSQDLSVCVSAMLEMLFSHLRSQERFRKIRLRDEPFVIRDSTLGPSKLLTNSRTYQGTFRRPILTGRKINIRTQDTNTPDIDIQIPVDTILESLLQFAKQTPEVSHTLCVQIVKSLLQEGPGFASSCAISSLLTTALSKSPNDLTPLVLELSRLLIDDVCKEHGFQTSLEHLKDITAGTEGEFHTKLLYEETKLRNSNYDQFVLGSYGDLYGGSDVKMEEGTPFSVEDLTTTFGKLSNWDDLTMQKKRDVQSSGLPPLWTDRERFLSSISDFKGEGWFSKMLSSFRQEDKQDAMKWLREADHWPRRTFHISAISEAIEWVQSNNDNNYHYSCDLQPSDCLAEWAARLMIRSAYLNSMKIDSDSTPTPVMLSRSHELQWCERANERGLSSLVLDCVKRNKSDLCESETLPWLRQKILALRAMGLQGNDSALLKRGLTAAETYTYQPQFAQHSSAGINIDMNKLILQLNLDLKSLSKAKLQDIIQEVTQQTKREDYKQTNRQAVSSIYEMAVSHYDDLWNESSAAEQDDLLSTMSDILDSVTQLNLPKLDAFTALMLNRLGQYTGLLSDSTAKKILVKIDNLPNLCEFSLQHLKSNRHVFPSHLLNEFDYMSERDDDSMLKYKRCFQLIGDAEYSLLQYCDLLIKALDNNDANNWNEVFDRMRQKMFENPYAGSDYQLLTKHKNKLYEIRDYDPQDNFKITAKQLLKQVIKELRQRTFPPQKVLRLSQLCPALCRDTGPERDRCLARLLDLPGTVTVVKFDEQVPVFTDSVRRPAIIRALLSNGQPKRFLHKSGESLRVDAAAQTTRLAATRVWGDTGGGYTVTPLSEDCGLIEFLEDHERLRSLIKSSHDIENVLDTVPRPADDGLILAPIQACLQQHHQLCDKVPSHALRSAIERNSASVQDFIAKKQRFLDTVASMTILNWILGLGDRHLQNIMYSIQDGGVCCVDWNALFQYGDRELPPARLTRNILAVCDAEVLESRLQQLLGKLRDSNILFLAVVKLSFKWMGADFDDKYPYIESILQGKARSYDVTRQAIDASTSKYKGRVIQLLDNVFRQWDVKDMYSVEEQVACLLQHCTDPQILSVTRSGWEPWI